MLKHDGCITHKCFIHCSCSCYLHYCSHGFRLSLVLVLSSPLFMWLSCIARAHVIFTIARKAFVHYSCSGYHHCSVCAFHSLLAWSRDGSREIMHAYIATCWCLRDHVCMHIAHKAFAHRSCSCYLHKCIMKHMCGDPPLSLVYNLAFDPLTHTPHDMLQAHCVLPPNVSRW